MKKQTLLVVFAALMLASVSVLATLAYLTDRDAVANTFTVGQVDIALDEAAVTPDGRPILDDAGNPVERVKGNEYHLVPGCSYTKDPTLTVKAGSEQAYLRMTVTVNCQQALDAVFAPTGADLRTLFTGYDETIWGYAGELRDETADTVTYEFRYKEPVAGADDDTVLEPLFTGFTLPGAITGEQLASISDLTITVNGHAVQAATFADADEAWAAFDQQVVANP